MKILLLTLLFGSGITEDPATRPISERIVVLQDPKPRNWKIETEPAGIVLNGFILQVSRKVVSENLFMGLYTFSINIPDKMKVNMINNLDPDADVRIGFELALVTRYRFLKLNDGYSGAYAGFTFGWEYFDITKENTTDLRINTYVATPHLGFEYYFFNSKRLFINPSLRGVFYLGESKSDATRSENMKPFYLLPAVAIGVRF